MLEKGSHAFKPFCNIFSAITLRETGDVYRYETLNYLKFRGTSKKL